MFVKVYLYFYSDILGYKYYLFGIISAGKPGLKTMK